MTQENFNKAKDLQEQLAKVTKEIEGSYLPDGSCIAVVKYRTTLGTAVRATSLSVRFPSLRGYWKPSSMRCATSISRSNAS